MPQSAKMFQNLRKKVNAVLPDIENIYLTSTSPSVSSPHRVLNHLGLLIPSPSSTLNEQSKLSTEWPNSSAVNFDAGCKLLERNEQIWEELHSNNESNAKKAETCDRLISKLSNSIQRRCVDLSDICVSLEIVPNVVKTLERCSATIIDINEKCTEVENQLYELEDLIEVLELQEKQLNSKFEMALFKERKLGKYTVEMIKRIYQHVSVSDTFLFDY